MLQMVGKGKPLSVWASKTGVIASITTSVRMFENFQFVGPRNDLTDWITSRSSMTFPSI